jgi:hypothetical protein
MLGAPGGTVTRRSSPWLLLCSKSHGAQGHHDHDPELMGRRTTGVMGVAEIVSLILEPTERRTNGMCGVIRFCVIIFFGLLLLSPALTDARDLSPLVSVWVCPAHGAVTKRHGHRAAVGWGG